jgi:DNA end-binding protein Ku
MPRAIWSGSISFGLVNIPIRLYNAVSRKSVSFNQIDSRTGSRIKYEKVSAADGSKVPNDAIVKGYEISPDRYVLIDAAELDALDPEATRTIDIEEFIDLPQIDPMFFDAAYYVAPAKAAEKPYRLLVEAMEQQNKVAIARLVMRTKQYLAALRPKDGALVLSTMVYADEIAPADDIPELDGLDEVQVSERELTMATSLIESLSSDFEPERYRDEYRDRVLDLIERKAQGEEPVVEAPAAADSGRVVDLMAALEASVAAARESRGRHPTARDPEAAAEARDEAAAEEAPAEEVAVAAGGGATKRASTRKTTTRKATARKKGTAKKAGAKQTKKSA